MTDVVIIGAGVVGGMIARELAKYELGVTIVEKMPDVAMGATRANSAIVHAGFDAKEGTLKAKLNVKGSLIMEDVTRTLGVKYKKNGSLVVGFNEDDEKALKELLVRGEKNGVAGLKLLYGDEIRAIEKNIGDEVTVALHAPTGAIVCPYELCMASVGNAMDNGAALLVDFEVVGISKKDGKYEISAKDGRCVSADIVINCAGVYSDTVADMAGKGGFTVTPRRGEYMLLDRECGEHVSHTIFRCPSKMGKGVLVTPTVDGNLLLGPTAENIDDKENTATTEAGLASLCALANQQVKGINMRAVITSFTGLRSTGSTGDFIINMEDGFVNAAGIESPGLSSAPAIAEYVRELIENSGITLTRKSSVIEERRPMHYFREADVDTKNEIIKGDSTFAHVICRCETVTEGEILEAIRTNPKPRDVDGVKRRTRASMGRCQGGFCTPYIVELLSKELDIPYESVTKFGGGSYINFGKTKEN